MFERSAIEFTPPGAWDGEELWFESLTGHDAIGECFRFELTFCAENRDLAAEDALGQPVLLSVEESERTRYFHGYVDEFTVMGLGEGINDKGYASPDIMRYQLILRPSLWFLSKATDNRIFQQMTVPAIFEQVLADHGFTNFRNDLAGTYDPREYCVQYAESDLNFLERLMQHERIWYYFEHTADGHTAVLVDRNAAVDDGQHELDFRQDRRSAGKLPEITEWRPVNRVVSGSFHPARL